MQVCFVMAHMRLSFYSAVTSRSCLVFKKKKAIRKLLSWERSAVLGTEKGLWSLNCNSESVTY